MTPQQKFWRWFIKHEDNLFHFDRNREIIFEKLSNELTRIHPDLCFEFGPQVVPREFVVSAGGIKDGFPSVISLVTSAPTLERWKVTAFRPRRHPLHAIEFAGKRVDPTDVQFSLLVDGKNIGLYLFMPGYRESDMDFKQIGYLLLDEALGEYDVESRLGLIKILPPEQRTEGERYALAVLPEKFDRLVSQLKEFSERPS